MKRSAAPSTEVQQAVREMPIRGARTVQPLADPRRSERATIAQQRAQHRTTARACLQGEIRPVQRMRNILVNRPYCTLDDISQMEQHAVQLIKDYWRTCE